MKADADTIERTRAALRDCGLPECDIDEMIETAEESDWPFDRAIPSRVLSYRDRHRRWWPFGR